MSAPQNDSNDLPVALRRETEAAIQTVRDGLTGHLKLASTLRETEAERDEYATDARQYQDRLNRQVEANAALRAELRAKDEALRDYATLARWFHEEYEARAGDFGYETRRDSAVPWKLLSEQMRGLMVATVAAVIGRALGED